MPFFFQIRKIKGEIIVIKNAARSIIEAVGIENIKSVSHCATRIRIVPKKAKNISQLDETNLIKGSLFANNQFQVFVQLSDIEEVYKEINKELAMYNKTK